MKKLIILALALSFLLSGCIESVQLTKRAIIQGIAIDKDGNDLIMSVEIISTVLSSEEGIVSYVVSQKEKTLQKASEELELKIGKKLFLGQTKVIIFGKELAKNSIRDSVLYFNDNIKVRPSVNVFIADEKAQDVIEMKFENGELLSNTVDRIATNLFKEKKMKKVKFFDLAKNLKQKDLKLDLPVIKIIEKKEIIIESTAEIENFVLD